MYWPTGRLCLGYIRTCWGDGKSKRKAYRREEVPETEKRELKTSENRRWVVNVE